ncbi:immune inhibitor A domain-containing protein [Actinoplanes sp. NBRC 103695]|uniref:immune inhibitor A domain-containing protein n=1 Tax=Actinoplanes sp. NBRC 103695 TaxID=3032202 RepID=UPI00255263EE|nr:immune inhibitor A domain-containing protein [Actinoplanes sp. NBRC 103695]
MPFTWTIAARAPSTITAARTGTKLHRDADRQGLDSIRALVESEGDKLSTFLHAYQISVLTDRIVEGERGTMSGIEKFKATPASVSSPVNLADDSAYATPGAPPNGADYIPLGDSSKLRSLRFNGDPTFPVTPLSWTVTSSDPDRPGDAVMFSGNENNTDSSAVTKVSVPSSNAALTFQARYGAEEGYDFGYVLVSTDGGKTYTAIPGDKTVDGPDGPAVTGSTEGFRPHRYDLSAYAGKEILLGFRYVGNEGG